MKVSRIRKFFVLAFTSGLFVALAVTALIIARGNILTDQGLVATGSVRLSVSPTGGYRVFLNEQNQELANNNVTNVTPGTYDLKVEKTGYTSWNQSIDVKAGLVTDVSVQLFPQELKLEQLTKINIDKAFFSNSHRYAYYTIVNYPLGTNIGIWKQTLQQTNIPLIEEKPLKITNLTALIEKDIIAGSFTIKPANDDSKIILKTSDSVYILDTTRYNEPSTDNKLDVSYVIDDISWLRGSSNLLIRSADLLIDYDLDKKSSTIITYKAGQSPIYTASTDSVVYVQDKKLYKYTPGSNIAIKLENVTLPTGITAVNTGSTNDTNIILKAGTSLYYLNVTESYLTELGSYDLLSVSPSGRNLLVIKDKAISSIEVNISLVLNLVETTKRATGLTSEIDISGLIWDQNSNYFVFQNTGEKDKIYSADASGNNVNLLLFSPSITSPAYFGLPENNSGLMIKLLDSKEQSAENDQRANLYRLGFNQ